MASLTSTAGVRLLPPEISPVDIVADLSVPSLWWWRFSPVVVLVGTVGLPLVFPLLAAFYFWPPADASDHSSHIATNLPLHILSALFCCPGGVTDDSTTGCSSLVPPQCVTAPDGTGLWFAATIDMLDSDPAPVPCRNAVEATFSLRPTI